MSDPISSRLDDDARAAQTKRDRIRAASAKVAETSAGQAFYQDWGTPTVDINSSPGVVR